MRNILILTCLLGTFSVDAQRMTAGISYEYFYSPSMDKLIQTYNFDRPFLQNKQPLFINALNASFSVHKKCEKHWKHGFVTTYSIMQSFAENDNFMNRFIFNRIDIGYSGYYQDSSKFGRFYSETQITSTFSGLYRRTNEAAYIYDSTRSHSLGVGGTISFLIGYGFELKNKSILSPTIQFSFTPFIFAPNNEAVINATKGLITASWQSYFFARAGFAYHFGK